MKTLVIFIFLSLFTHNLEAYNSFNIRPFGIEKGLSHANVTSILIDSRGILWIGTAFGLNYYDGNDMKSYFHKKEVPFSLPSNYILYLAEDTQNNIWVSTMNGLVRYNKERFTPPIAGQKTESYCFHYTKQGILFGGNGQLYEFNYKNKIFRKLPLKGVTANVSHIRKWINDIYLLVLSSGEIKEYHYDTGILTPSIFTARHEGIADIYIDNEQNLYLAVYQQGLYMYNRNGQLKNHLTTRNSPLTYNTILDIEEKDGNLWLATDGGGINIMNISSQMLIDTMQHTPGDINTLPSNSINHLYKDKQKNIWAGSVREGAFEIKQTYIHTYRNAPFGEDYGLSNQSIISFCQDEQKMFWIGTDGGGINMFNPQNKKFTHFPSTANEKIISIVNFSPSELLAILYLKGIYLFNKRTGQCMPFNPPFIKHTGAPNKIYQVTDNCLLILSNTPCLYEIDTQKTRILKLKQLPDSPSSAVLVGTTEEFIYLQMRNNLLSLDLKNNELSLYHTFSADEILQVASYDSNGFFWIGTDRGLRKYDPHKKKCEIIQTNLFNRVTALIPENNTKLWINAQNALFSYDLKNKIFLSWDESDGFSKNELTGNSSYTYNECIYLAGLNGLAQIDKKMTDISPAKTKISLTDIILDGISISENINEVTNLSEISIPWDYKLLQLKIADIANDIFEKRLFRYIVRKYTISGDEEKIIETYNPTISLDMLSPGEYHIHASVYTKNGTWSNPQQILHLYVETPWYKDSRIIIGTLIFIFSILIWGLVIYFQWKKKKMKRRMDEIERNADREKVQFLINISHELRTPLTLIYAPLKRMLEKVSTNTQDSEKMEFLKKQLINVHRASNQMRNIINMTLDVNRISEKGNTIHIQPHMLNEWIRVVASEFEYEFKNRSIKVNYMLDEQITFIDFDDSKSESILSNLLMNALKFSEENTVITISSMLMTDMVRIAVSDKGIGLGNIDPELLFIRFYQGEHNRQGSGIGLYYSKLLINQQNGKIGAFNNPDKGATFYFEFPLRTNNSPEIPLSINLPISGLSMLSNTESIDMDAPVPTLPTDAYSVVVVEDNTELAQYLSEALKEKFQTVYVASNGEKAWQIISEKMPDIVVSDVMMPLKDGYELCRQIKEDMLTCHIPVILLTARSDKDSTITGYKLGADAYIPKPFETEFLLVMVFNLLRNRERMKKKYRETFVRITEEDDNNPITNRDEEFLSKLNKLIVDNLSSSDLNVKYMTEQIGMSRSALYAKLKALTNMGVNDYINQIRIEKASLLLLRPELTIAEISDAVGFEYQKYFSTLFKQIKGVTPSEYRQANT